jgi:hypothetical protein
MNKHRSLFVKVISVVILSLLTLDISAVHAASPRTYLIVLQAANGKLLSEKGATLHASASRGSDGGVFKLLDHNGNHGSTDRPEHNDRISLVGSSRYVYVEHTGDGTLTFTKAEAAPTEAQQFIISKPNFGVGSNVNIMDGNIVTLRTRDGIYFTTDQATGAVSAKSTSVGAAEQFVVRTVQWNARETFCVMPDLLLVPGAPHYVMRQRNIARIQVKERKWITEQGQTRAITSPAVDAEFVPTSGGRRHILVIPGRGSYEYAYTLRYQIPATPTPTGVHVAPNVLSSALIYTIHSSYCAGSSIPREYDYPIAQSPRVYVRGTARPSSNLPEIREICYGEPIPAGFIKTNDIRLNTCPGSSDITEPNAARIYEYAAARPPASLTVCLDQPTPQGWTELRRYRDFRCRYSVLSYEPNVKDLFLQ